MCCVLMASSVFAKSISKGIDYDRYQVAREGFQSEDPAIDIDYDFLLQYATNTGTAYNFSSSRPQAVQLGRELSTTPDAYKDWTMNVCGQERLITAYSGTADGDGVVIGTFTLESEFSPQLLEGEIAFLKDLRELELTRTNVLRRNVDGQVELGDGSEVGLIHNGGDGLVEYKVMEEQNQAYLDGVKPTKSESINASKICVSFGSSAAGRDIWITEIGLFLDSVPANTKMRVGLYGQDQLDIEYPFAETVTYFDSLRGLGDSVAVSTYADETTWNRKSFIQPAIIHVESTFQGLYSFTDETGAARALDIPIDTSITDSVAWLAVRSNNIQSASGTSITLDTNATAADGHYVGMRLYIGGEYRDITAYNGTTKVATINSAFSAAPSPSDAYDIKVLLIRPMVTYKYKTVRKGQVNTGHNTYDWDNTYDGETIALGSKIYGDTSADTFDVIVPIQFGEFLGGQFTVIDKEGTFTTNPLTVDFDDFDYFDGAPVDYACNDSGFEYEFRYTDDDNGWTVEKRQNLAPTIYRATDDTIYIGDRTTDDTLIIDTVGDIYFTGSAGLPTANISVNGNAVETSIAAKDTWTKITVFDTNEPSNIFVADQANNEIDITVGGITRLHFEISFWDGPLKNYEIAASNDNCTTVFSNVHAERTIGAAGDIGSVSGAGNVLLSDNDSVCLCIQNTTDATNPTLKDISYIADHKGGGN